LINGNGIDIKPPVWSEATVSLRLAQPRPLPSARQLRLLEVTALLRLMLVVLFVAVAGATAFIVTWDIPAPTKQVETVVPDERLPR
jgi:hypothetical protein